MKQVCGKSGLHDAWRWRCGPVQRGFALIEIIIVIALMAFVYTVALPQLGVKTGTEIANKLNQLLGDVRSAYDLSVLTGKTYRLVFVMATGDYWLEEADRPDVYLGSDKADRDPSAEEEKDEQVNFDQRFGEFVELAGQAVMDPEAEKEIPPTSPVVQAKDKLRKPVWTKVESLEWGMRTIGPHLLIQDMQAEHHGQKQSFMDLGQEARAMIYIFPHGYVQKAVIHLAYRKGDFDIDDSKEPYTVVTNPWEGTAESQSGYVEVDVHADREG